MSTNAPPTENKIVPLREKVNTIRTLLEKAKPQIALALPKHLSADRMLRIAMTSIQKNPRLIESSPESLLSSIMQASQLGLECDGVLGQAYLVPFRNNRKNGILECQLIPGYKGLLKLARNSGELESIYGYAVFEGDTFDVDLGMDPNIKHKPNWDARDFQSEKEIKEKLRFVYAVAKVKGAEPQFEVMSKSAIERIRKRSKSADDGPWVTDYEAMALKTVIKKLSKILPSSVELQRAIDLDANAELGLPQDAGELIDFIPSGSVTTVEETGGQQTGQQGKLEKLTDKAKADKAAKEVEALRNQITEKLLSTGEDEEHMNGALKAASLEDGVWLQMENLKDCDDPQRLRDILKNLEGPF